MSEENLKDEYEAFAKKGGKKAETPKGDSDGGEGGGEPTTPEIKASAAAEKLAEENEIDLSKVEGTGQGGSITVGDVKAFIEAE